MTWGPSVLVAYALEAAEWRVTTTLTEAERGRVPPFAAVELDLGAMHAVD
jgi:hypothetical protein